jgi:hypothetical protein
VWPQRESLCALALKTLPQNQTYHWNEKRRIAEYYAQLAQKEQEDEAAYTADLRGKLKTLEEELLA